MFSWFSSGKKNARHTLFKGMTDIHTHLLPGVDDGVQTVEDSIRILHFMHETGVERIYLTPHVMTDLPANTPEALQSKYESFLKVCPEGMELRLAAEYMLDGGFAQLTDKGLLSMHGRHVLVETSYLSPPFALTEMLYDLRTAGYRPIIAHPERYLYMRNSDYHKLKEQGCKLQLNLFSLTGAYGLHAERNATYILKQGLYDHAGSDVHKLENYREGITFFSPHKSLQKELERIADNNRTLWE
ncbi:MAG: hypothetical protein LBJ39_06240 [Tannerellaceae bacterium]|jgi:tyrosine-protein phosphatase YwqE|nr:hypothetical protein [Tannerellaceae bacterium]